MAKINLMTIHWGGSYGALMQTYATTKILEECGHEVKVINLINPRYKHPYHSIKNFLLDFIRNSQYDYFKKTLPLTNKGFEIEEINVPECDYVVVGSDQVWNNNITKPHGLHYFLDFAPAGVKRASLSSSMGEDEWDESAEYTDQVQSEINKFDAISVREQAGQKVLKDVFDIDAELLIDPTLAYRNFDSLLNDRRNSAMVFPFLFGKQEEMSEIVRFVSNTLHLKIYHNSLWKRIFKRGPISWLENIHNAGYVVTNSFHCIAFCLIFHTPFIALNCGHISRMGRLFDILKKVGMSDRYVPSLAYLKEHSNILKSNPDFEYSDDILNVESAKYRNFVKKNIR